MLIINKNKPFYIDKNNKLIRMGNFTETGKEIEYDDDSLLSIFNNIQNPVSMTTLVSKVYKETKVNKKDIQTAINYLINEKFIIKYEDYKNIIADKKYNRQNLYFSMFNDNYKSFNNNFKNKKILILGLGGIGSNVTLLLERAGFNSFILVDHDYVEESNLIRQFPYTFNDIGKLKTEVLKNKLNNCNVKWKNIKVIKEKDIISSIKEADFVLCTIDKPQRIVRRLINKISVENNKPVLFCGFSEHFAMIGPFIKPKQTACLGCIEIENQNSEYPINNVDLIPSFGPLCLLISSLVGNEIINYFSNYNELNLLGKTLMFDMATYQTKIIEWKKSNRCKECEQSESN